MTSLKGRRSGSSNPMYGRKQTEHQKRRVSETFKGVPKSELTRAKISLSMIGKKCKPISETHRRNLSRSLKGKKFSEEHKKNISKRHFRWFGSKNPNWNGGTSFLPYCYKFNITLKELVCKRDNHACQLCGKTQEKNGRKLDIHHIHYDKENCYPDLIALCRSCNLKANAKVKHKYYEQLFMNNLNERQLLSWVRGV